MDENGRIPANALMEAKRQKDAMIVAERNDPARDAGLTPASWTWLGPGNIGGRVRALVIHPTQPGTMWCGSVSGGIWKTTNGGKPWFPLNDFLPALTVSCMVLDPTNPDILYAGTGEDFFNADARPGAGVFKSSDGGATWEQLASTVPPAGTDPRVHPWGYVNRLALSPTDGRVLLAGTRRGIFRSADGGVSWSQRNSNRTLDVDFDPMNGTRAIAGQIGAAMYSTDSGVTWLTASTNPPLGVGRVEVAYARSDPNRVYASVDDGSRLDVSTNGGADYRRIAVNYEGAPPAGGYLEVVGSYANTVWVDPTNPDRIVVGGFDLWRGNVNMGVFPGVTLANLTRWRASGLKNVPWCDQHAVVSHPGFNGTTNRTVFLGNDGGVSKARDITTVDHTKWEKLNVGLGITQFYGAAACRNGIVLGGTQDRATVVFWPTNFFRQWGLIDPSDGDGGFCACDQGASADLAHALLYLSGQYGRIRRSTNGGSTSEAIFAGIPEADNPLTCAFVAPFILDPNNNGRMLVGCRSLYESCDPHTGANWRCIKDPLTSFSKISAIAVARRSPRSATIGDRIAVGYANGEVWLTRRGHVPPDAPCTTMIVANDWERVDGNNLFMPPPDLLPARYCSRIAFDPADSSRIFVTFMGYGLQPTPPGARPPSAGSRYCNIWRGKIDWAHVPNPTVAWSPICGPAVPGDAYTLPAVPVTSIAVHPRQAGWAYIGTDIGVFASQNANDMVVAGTPGSGPRWHVYDGDPISGDGPANVPVDEVFFGHGDPPDPNPQLPSNILYAATHGRGVYKAEVVPPPAGPPRTTRVNLSSAPANAQTAAGTFSGFGSISHDGRFVAFTSSAAALVAGGTPGRMHVYVRDRQTQQTTRVSVDNVLGFQGNRDSFTGQISGDGRYVVFFSRATNFDGPITPGLPGRFHVYVRDRQTQSTSRVSLGMNNQEANADSTNCSISADGRFVAFRSQATNLVANNTGGRWNVFLHDRLARSTVLVSRTPGGNGGNQDSSLGFIPVISGRGSFVAYTSVATDLVPEGTNGRNQVFRYDRLSGQNELVSVRTDGTEGNDHSTQPSISANGGYIAFRSLAANLAPGNTFGQPQIYLRDMNLRTTVRVSVNAQGDGGDLPSSIVPWALSPDGRYAAFESEASNLHPSATGRIHILLRDLEASSLSVVTGNAANGDSSEGVVSQAGFAVVFSSQASNLVAGDTNTVQDVFAYDQVCALVTAQPVDQVVCSGSPAVFSVSALGGVALNYQWRKNGVDIAGATSSTYVINPTAVADAGDYTVRISSICGSAETVPADLFVVERGSGDVNLDFVLDGADIQAFVTILTLTPDGPATPSFCAADMDRNGRVTAADVPLLIAKLLNP